MPLDIFQATTTEMFILLFLSKEDAHGYQLAQMLEARSGGLLCVKATSLYPLLYNLKKRAILPAEHLSWNESPPCAPENPLVFALCIILNKPDSRD